MRMFPQFQYLLITLETFQLLHYKHILLYNEILFFAKAFVDQNSCFFFVALSLTQGKAFSFMSVVNTTQPVQTLPIFKLLFLNDME